MELIREDRDPSGMRNSFLSASSFGRACDNPAVLCARFFFPPEVGQACVHTFGGRRESSLLFSPPKTNVDRVADLTLSSHWRPLYKRIRVRARGSVCLFFFLKIGEAPKDFFSPLFPSSVNRSRLDSAATPAFPFPGTRGKQRKKRIEGVISPGVEEGEKNGVEGSNRHFPIRKGNFLLPPRFWNGVPATSSLSSPLSIFGPVLSLIHANPIDDSLHISKSPLAPGVSLHYPFLPFSAEIPLRSSGGKICLPLSFSLHGFLSLSADGTKVFLSA